MTPHDGRVRLSLPEKRAAGLSSMGCAISDYTMPSDAGLADAILARLEHERVAGLRAVNERRAYRNAPELDQGWGGW